MTIDLNSISITDLKERCRLKPHPACVMSKTLRYLKEGLTFEEALKKAKAECLAEGKFHPTSKLSCLYHIAEEEFESKEGEL